MSARSLIGQSATLSSEPLQLIVSRIDPFPRPNAALFRANESVIVSINNYNAKMRRNVAITSALPSGG